MKVRLTVILLIVSVTFSLAWSPNGAFTFYPFLLPAVLLVGRWRAPRLITTIPMLCGVLSMLALASAAMNGASIRYSILWFGLAALYMGVRFVLPSLTTDEQFARLLAFVVGALMILSVYQYLNTTMTGSPYEYLDRLDMLALAKEGGGQVQRVPGVFFNCTIFGQWLIYIAILLIPSMEKWPLARRTLVLSCVAIPLLLTFSRLIWVAALFLALLFLLGFATKSGGGATMILLVLPSIALLLMLVPLPPALTSHIPDRFSLNDISESTQERQLLNYRGEQYIEASPAFGVGYAGLGDGSKRPHNVFVQVAAEQGVATAGGLFLLDAALVITGIGAASKVWYRRRYLALSLLSVPVIWTMFLLFYSSAAEYAVLPVLVTTVAWLHHQVDVQRGSEVRIDMQRGQSARPTTLGAWRGTSWR